jgi:hypothetical protein
VGKRAAIKLKTPGTTRSRQPPLRCRRSSTRLLERLARERGVHVRSGQPAVALRETVGAEAAVEFLYTLPSSPDGKHPEPAAGARALGKVLAPAGPCTR